MSGTFNCIGSEWDKFSDKWRNNKCERELPVLEDTDAAIECDECGKEYSPAETRLAWLVQEEED